MIKGRKHIKRFYEEGLKTTYLHPEIKIFKTYLSELDAKTDQDAQTREQ